MSLMLGAVVELRRGRDVESGAPATVVAPAAIPQGRCRVGQHGPLEWNSDCAPWRSRNGEHVAVKSRKGQPNKRLKLPGVDRSGGIGVLIANLHPLTFSVSCAGAGSPAA